MLNLDVGGQKGKIGNWKIREGEWPTLDIHREATFVHDLNLKKPLPFRKSIIDNIYTSATLEHIEPENITFVLQEFYRILKPGGKCRIVVPDCAHAIDLYVNNPKELSNKKYTGKPKWMPETPMGYLTSWFYTNKRNLGIGHKIGFDEELLRAFIARTKFKDVRKMSYNDCSEVFKGLDRERYADWFLYFEMTA